MAFLYSVIELNFRLTISGARVEAIHFRPVHYIPKRLEVIRPLILVLKIIGVFPYIDTQDGAAFTARNGFAHDGIVLVGGRRNLELAAIDQQPRPAATKSPDTSGFKLFFEGLEAAECRIDR